MGRAHAARMNAAALDSVVSFLPDFDATMAGMMRRRPSNCRVS
jgi:hypothetical protein